MRCKISQSDFSKALLASNKSVMPKANLPILSNVLLSVSKSGLEILSTDLETATRVSIPCKGELEGRVTVSGRVLAEFVSQLPEGEINCEKLGEELSVSARGFSARLAMIAPEEFPVIPKIDKGKEMRILADKFVESIKRVAFSAASDEGRPILTGVLCEFGKRSLSMVATDGYRLSFCEMDTSQNLENLRVVVPAKAMLEVAKLIEESLEEMEGKELAITIADNLSQINFRIDEVEFTSRLIEGEFPNWQKIIPSSFTTKVKVSRGDFIKLIKIASIFARDSGNIVRLKFDPGTGDKTKEKIGKLTIFAIGSQVGSNESSCEVVIDGKGGEIAFNFRYLLEALSSFENEEVGFEMIESLNPGKLTGAKGDVKSFHIIMPVRLQS